MYYKTLIVAISLFGFTSCESASGKPRNLYAVLTVRDRNKPIPEQATYLRLMADEPPIKFGPDGLNSRRTSQWYLFVLQGDGPIYRNPKEYRENPGRPISTQGAVIVNAEQSRVTIDLVEVDNSGGSHAKPCDANGSYAIKRRD